MRSHSRKSDREKAATRRKTSRFARELLAEWRRRGWPEMDERVVVAVSGGADSMALLLALDELRKSGRLDLSLTLAHLNHGLRGRRGAEDARWVKEQAAALGYETIFGRARVAERARARRDNLEQAARLARYEFLREVARGRAAAVVLTAHTLDDQAETILLRLLRGSGAEGLAGMRPERALDTESGVRLLRPLLMWARRVDTEDFCRARGVEFRADEMNEDEGFARVRVRRRLLPMLETFNPRAVEALARAGQLLGEDAAALDAAAARLLEEARAPTAKAREEVDGGDGAVESAGGAWLLRVEMLSAAPPAVRRRALRLWIARGRGDLRRIEMAHLLAVEKLSAGERGGRVAELPGGSFVERRRKVLRFFAAHASPAPLEKERRKPDRQGGRGHAAQDALPDGRASALSPSVEPPPKKLAGGAKKRTRARPLETPAGGRGRK